jgi:hypothetical protein
MSVKASGTPGQTESVGKAIRLLALFRGAQTPVRIAEAIRQDRATRAYCPGPAGAQIASSHPHRKLPRRIAGYFP